MKNAWPVVGRELRVASRRPATWLARSSVAGLAVGLTAFILWKAMGITRAQLGGAAFALTPPSVRRGASSWRKSPRP